MKVRVIGKEIRKGVSKKNGKPYDATVAHVAFAQRGCEGEAVESVWIYTDFLPSDAIIVGCEYSLERSRNGYLMCFDLL